MMMTLERDLQKKSVDWSYSKLVTSEVWAMHKGQEEIFVLRCFSYFI